MTEPGRAESAAALAQCPRLAAGEPFDFVCAGCGDCCRNRRDLVLSGYDLYRIARRLGLPPRLTADAFCKQEFAPQTLLPAVVLRPNARTGNCPFLRPMPAPSTPPARWPALFTRWARPLTRQQPPWNITCSCHCAVPAYPRRNSAPCKITWTMPPSPPAPGLTPGGLWCVPSFRISCSRQADAKTRATCPPPDALHAPCILIIPSRMILPPVQRQHPGALAAAG